MSITLVKISQKTNKIYYDMIKCVCAFALIHPKIGDIYTAISLFLTKHNAETSVLGALGNFLFFMRYF